MGRHGEALVDREMGNMGLEDGMVQGLGSGKQVLEDDMEQARDGRAQDDEQGHDRARVDDGVREDDTVPVHDVPEWDDKVLVHDVLVGDMGLVHDVGLDEARGTLAALGDLVWGIHAHCDTRQLLCGHTFLCTR